MLTEQHVTEMLKQIALGRHVAIIAELPRRAMNEVLDLMPPEVVDKVKRTTGQARIDLSNGANVYFPLRQGWGRGLNLGLVIALCPISEDFEAELKATCLATTGGAILY